MRKSLNKSILARNYNELLRIEITMIPLEDTELKLIREFIAIPIVLTVFERDKKIIESSTIKTKSPYIDTINRGMDQAHKDLVETRRSMRAIKLKMQLIDKPETGLTYLIVYNGYEHRKTYLWEKIKIDVEIKMRQYLGEDVSKYNDYGV